MHPIADLIFAHMRDGSFKKGRSLFARIRLVTRIVEMPRLNFHDRRCCMERVLQVGGEKALLGILLEVGKAHSLFLRSRPSHPSKVSVQWAKG